MKIRKKILDENNEDKELQINLANTYEKIGVLHLNGERVKEAISYFENQFSILYFSYSFPTKSLNAKKNLSEVCYLLGTSYFIENKKKASINCLLAFLELVSEMKKQYPKFIPSEKSIWKAHDKLGATYFNLEIWNKSVLHYTNKNILLSELSFRSPKDFDVKSELAKSFGELGLTHQEIGENKLALKYFESFHSISKELYISNNSTYKGLFSNSFIRLKNIYDILEDNEKHADVVKNHIDLLEKVVANNPTNLYFIDNLAILYYDLGNIYSDLEDKDTALEFYNLYSAKRVLLHNMEPTDSYKSKLANSFFNLGKLHHKFSNYEDALNNYKKSTLLYNDLIDANIENQDYNEDLADTFLRIGDINSEMGNLKSAFKNYFEAVSRIESLLKNFPDNNPIKEKLGTLFFIIGESYFKLKKYRDAIEFFKKMNLCFHQIHSLNAELCFKYSYSFKMLGWTYLELGENEKVINNFNRAVEISPDRVEFINDKAYALLKLGEYAKSYTTYKKSLERTPKDPMIHSNIGWVLLLQKKLSLAERHFKLAMQFGKNERSSPMNLGHIALLRGEQDKAFNFYKKSIELYSNKEEFFSGMEEDYLSVKMSDSGILKAEYDTIIQKLKNEDRDDTSSKGGNIPLST